MEKRKRLLVVAVAIIVVVIVIVVVVVGHNDLKRKGERGRDLWPKNEKEKQRNCPLKPPNLTQFAARLPSWVTALSSS